jgi:hypothetical protein
MNKETDKEFDDLFKKRLVDPANEAGYQEEDWNAFEKMLDKPKKQPGVVFWLPVLSSAAAILIFFGWLFLKQPVASHNQQQQPVAVNDMHKKDTLIKGDRSKNQIDGSKKETSPGLAYQNTKPTENTVVHSGSENSKSATPAGYVINNSRRFTKSATVFKEPIIIDDTKNNDQRAEKVDNRHEPLPLFAANHDIAFGGSMDNDSPVNPTVVTQKDITGNHFHIPSLPKEDNGTTKLGFVKHPQFALAFIGASELNGANTLAGAKAGTNLGLVFSAGLFKNLTVSTGGVYAVKPYNTSIAGYHTNYKFKTDPSNIEADCRVLDIPINLDYRLYNKHNNKFSIGTGLSSYIMLHESYAYYYANPGTPGPTAYTVKNEGKYFFSVVNLQATYQRQVNSKVGIIIQPYMKLPISNIGYSQVRLQTAGVAIGLNWNLNSLTKP